MNTSGKSPSKGQTTKKAESRLHDVKAKATKRLETYEEKVRQSPDKAILIAAATGYCLHLLPVRPLIAAPLRIIAFLAKPALLALGAAKLCEIAQDRARR